MLVAERGVNTQFVCANVCMTGHEDMFFRQEDMKTCFFRQEDMKTFFLDKKTCFFRQEDMKTCFFRRDLGIVRQGAL